MRHWDGGAAARLLRRDTQRVTLLLPSPLQKSSSLSHAIPSTPQFDAAMLHKAKLDVVVDAAPGEEAARVAVQGDESVSLVATASAEAAQMVNLLPVRGKEGALRFGELFSARVCECHRQGV